MTLIAKAALAFFIAISAQISHAQCVKTADKKNPSFVEEKVWPLHPEFLIKATATYQEGSGDSVDDASGLYDLFVELIDTRSGKQIHGYCAKGALDSNAMALTGISIDTAPYKLSSTVHAFGIRATHQNNSRIDPTSVSTIVLFGVKNNLVSMLLANTDLFVHHDELTLRENANGRCNEDNTVIQVLNTAHNDLYDLRLTKSSKQGVHNGGCRFKGKGKLRSWTLKYNGVEYK